MPRSRPTSGVTLRSLDIYESILAEHRTGSASNPHRNRECLEERAERLYRELPSHFICTRPEEDNLVHLELNCSVGFIHGIDEMDDDLIASFPGYECHYPSHYRVPGLTFYTVEVL